MALCDALKPDVVFANYIFMTRAFDVLAGRTTRTSKREKVVAMGVTDSLALTTEEEASLLARYLFARELALPVGIDRVGLVRLDVSVTHRAPT